jgi:hypothetical protein
VFGGFVQAFLLHLNESKRATLKDLALQSYGAPLLLWHWKTSPRCLWKRCVESIFSCSMLLCIEKLILSRYLNLSLHKC